MSDRTTWHKTYLAGSEDPQDDGELLAPDDTHPANLVSSLCADGLHRPALDIDIPCRVVPSSTPGHCHLYFDTVALDWPSYVELLDALKAAGILGSGFVAHSKNRGQTLLRLPHVKKEARMNPTPRVLGLDLSSTATGVCYPDGSTASIAPPKSLDMIDRVRLMADTIGAIPPCDVTVMEAIGTRHVQTAIAIASVHALVLDRMMTADGHPTLTFRRVIRATPTQLKKWATGKGSGVGTDKVGMSLAAARNGWDGVTDDEADAWWLWTLGREVAGAPVVELTAYRREVLRTLGLDDELRAA